MEIRDPVHGSLELSEQEVAVIDSAEYQRLRAIKQLGFSEFSFPGATHNRYLHSIGVCHLAGAAFDQLFKTYEFSSNKVRSRLRQAFRLGALLHDIGHGPLSHTTEEVMPQLSKLKVDVYKKKRGEPKDRKANHEDYTIKYLTDSPLSEILKKQFPDLTPLHVACLIDKALPCPDDFFMDKDLNFRPILSQLVSSELDVDRMDYLERDSYFCGTNYGKVDLSWLLANLTMYDNQGEIHLGLNRRALYTFDDFLISRHHMHLMVYFHHKSIIYEEMLVRYLTSKDCSFFLPSDINDYTRYNDYALYEHLAKVENKWAKRIAQRKPFRVLIELHHTSESPRPGHIQKALESEGLDVIVASSSARLSKYHVTSPDDQQFPIYVVDQYDKRDKPNIIEKSTQIFQKYEGARIIDRVYVAPEQYAKAQKVLTSKNL
ncbi:MAG: HD domain-containing protein [Pseudobdellovibrionaceae bacterium]